MLTSRMARFGASKSAAVVIFLVCQGGFPNISAAQACTGWPSTPGNVSVHALLVPERLLDGSPQIEVGASVHFPPRIWIEGGWGFSGPSLNDISHNWFKAGLGYSLGANQLELCPVVRYELQPVEDTHVILYGGAVGNTFHMADKRRLIGFVSLTTGSLDTPFGGQSLTEFGIGGTFARESDFLTAQWRVRSIASGLIAPVWVGGGIFF